jgi:hypothetical protein
MVVPACSQAPGVCGSDRGQEFFGRSETPAGHCGRSVGAGYRPVSRRVSVTKATFSCHIMSKDMILAAARKPFVAAFGQVRDLSC